MKQVGIEVFQISTKQKRPASTLGGAEHFERISHKARTTVTLLEVCCGPRTRIRGCEQTVDWKEEFISSKLSGMLPWQPHWSSVMDGGPMGGQIASQVRMQRVWLARDLHPKSKETTGSLPALLTHVFCLLFSKTCLLWGMCQLKPDVSKLMQFPETDSDLGCVYWLTPDFSAPFWAKMLATWICLGFLLEWITAKGCSYCFGGSGLLQTSILDLLLLLKKYHVFPVSRVKSSFCSAHHNYLGFCLNQKWFDFLFAAKGRTYNLLS